MSFLNKQYLSDGISYLYLQESLMNRPNLIRYTQKQTVSRREQSMNEPPKCISHFDILQTLFESV